MLSADQHDTDAENRTQVPHHIHFNDTLTKYPTWSTNTNDTENTNEAQYRESRQDILNAGKNVHQKRLLTIGRY